MSGRVTFKSNVICIYCAAGNNYSFIANLHISRGGGVPVNIVTKSARILWGIPGWRGKSAPGTRSAAIRVPGMTPILIVVSVPGGGWGPFKARAGPATAPSEGQDGIKHGPSQERVERGRL